MARPPYNPLAAKDLSRHVAKLSKKHPATAKDIELWAYVNLGARVGGESIRKALRGQVDPQQCAVELLMAFAGFYGVQPDELGSFAAARLAPALAFAGMMAPPEGPSGKVIDASGWFRPTAGLAAAS